jgi:hypothetical protein
VPAVFGEAFDTMDTFQHLRRKKVMKTKRRRILRMMLSLVMCCLGIALLSACTMSPYYSGYPAASNQSTGSAPTLSNMSVAPNPAAPGSIVNISATFVDPDADLQYGVAAVSFDGGKLSRMSFRATYVSGILTIPVPVSYYSRPSDVRLALQIRDSAGNWSNAVSTVLSIR